MKSHYICQVILLGMACIFLGACASHEEAKAKSGHWVTLPSETGTMIQRRVWVADGDGITNAPSMGNVQRGSARDLERAQQTTRSMRPPGS
jgi:hypothetical protein